MSISLARSAVALVAVVAVAGAVFRVSTAPDRIKERRNTAYSVCIASGGEWVKGERDEACVKPDGTKKP